MQVQELLEMGGGVNDRDEEKRTALHHAVEGGFKEIVRFLVKWKECDVNCGDVLNRTPLHVGQNFFLFFFFLKFNLI